jgi:tetratricopeptide (TPR) repeat protein
MHPLVEALAAEQEGHYQRALEYYLLMKDKGNILDRVAVWRSIARCLERLLRFSEAGRWRERVAEGFLQASEHLLPRGEATYYALKELSQALQDYRDDPSPWRKAAHEYLRLFHQAWATEPVGLVQEALTAATVAKKLGDHRLSGQIFRDLAEELLKDPGADLKLVRECYLQASEAYLIADERGVAEELAAKARGLPVEEDFWWLTER